MESTGTENTIQVSDAIYRSLRDKYQFSDRATVNIKGKGMMDIYRLLAPV
jgi:hypothetical protein